MGEKRPKDVEQNDTVSASSSVFKTLFGDVEQNAASVSTAVPSIFSDNNPFKRKPQVPKLDSDPYISNENPKNTDFKSPINANFDEVTKQKRNKDKNPNFDQEAKKLKTQFENLGFESNESLKEEKIQTQKDKSNKNKRKRKRDELEREFEVKKYGELPENADENAGGVVGEKRKKADDEADMLVSKDGEGFDDEDKLLRTVFVGNLPLKMKKKAVIREFSLFGEIESVRIRSVPIADTKVPRKGAVILKKIHDKGDSVHAYVVFKTEQSAEASLAHNMAVVGGNHIRVDRACPPRKKFKGQDAPLYDNKRTIFLGNLPFDVKDEEVYQLFSGIKGLESSIEAVRVIRHRHIHLGIGVGYVLFRTREAANLAVKKRHLKIRDRELRLSHARQNSTPSKRKSAFPHDIAESPTKKLAVDSGTPDHNTQQNSKAAASYQGLRAGKSSGQKKVRLKHNDGGEKRQGKRPAVAARKTRAQALKDGGASKLAGQKQVGQKRKLDCLTPESSNRKKKAKKFR